MRKFFATLFILIALSAGCLFLGWAQMGVPPDAYGLIRSKTHGLDTRLVIPGEFRWVWYKLIPTNVKTIVFRLDPVNHAFQTKNTLPSGKVYAAFAGIDEDFSWEISAAFSFLLKPETLVTLVSVDNIGSQEELALKEGEIAEEIKAFVLRRINLDGEFSGHIQELLQNGESPEFEQEILAQFPLVTNFSLKLKSAAFPDFALYQQIRGLYEYYIAFQKEYMSGDLQDKAKIRMESFRRFDELEQYGALLTKYPILLDYLALGNKENQ